LKYLKLSVTGLTFLIDTSLIHLLPEEFTQKRIKDFILMLENNIFQHALPMTVIAYHTG